MEFLGRIMFLSVVIVKDESCGGLQGYCEQGQLRHAVFCVSNGELRMDVGGVQEVAWCSVGQ